MAVMQTKSFTGKVAFVTGGSRGIGAGIVRRLARDGAAGASHGEGPATNQNKAAIKR